jgi:glycosyltransferase involved in cell wall biosynthesis
MKVSIIITNYNYSKFLNRAIRSVFTQNFPTEKFEIIVVDDASTDWSHEIIESYGALIEKVYLKENVGLSKAKNIGIECAKGEYLLFVDADDYVHRDLIYIESLCLDLNPKWQAVAVDYLLVSEKEKEIKRVSCDSEPIACGIMFRKEKLLEIGLFDESFKIWEEKDFRARFTKKFKINRIPLPLYRYRRHDNNLTSDKELSDKFKKEIIKKYGKDSF